MALGNVYKVGVGNVGSYQISGIPWAQTFTTSGSETVDELNFNIISGGPPCVTKWIKIRNISATTAETVKLGFSALGIAAAGTGQNPWITLEAGSEWLHLEVRVSSIFLVAAQDTPSVEIIAGLTPIQSAFSDHISDYLGVGDGALD